MDTNPLPNIPNPASDPKACDTTLTAKGSDDSFSPLREALDDGLSPENALGISKDTDLVSLHNDPRFAALVAHAKEVASSVQEPKSPIANRQP